MSEQAVIFYKDIGDYLSREQKLATVAKLRSVLNPAMEWTELRPNEHGDWLNQRNDAFSQFIPLAPEEKFDAKAQAFFSTYAIGVSTNRDAWVYNFSKDAIEANMRRMIDFYNQQRAAFAKAKEKRQELAVDDFIDTNPIKISWTRALRKDVANNITRKFAQDAFYQSVYRPFCKQYLYYDLPFIESPGLWSQLFPTPKHENLIICVSSVGAHNGLSILLCDCIPNLHYNGDTQCFPLYWYEEAANAAPTLFDAASEKKRVRRDGISDFILKRAREEYGGGVTKEDIFYYVYGFLHSPDYRKNFANDLKKMLPRLPLVENAAHFWTFSRAGRELAELHLDYEEQKRPGGVEVSGEDQQNFIVDQMRFPAKGQKDKIIYNNAITVSNVPAAAYDYIVNGKSAVEWVMERYAVTTHKESGIRNDPNDWAREHGNPRYILDLLLSVIGVSVQTVDIVNGLPKVEFGNV